MISLYPERIQTMVLLKMQQLSALKNAASAVMELKNGGVNAVLIDTIMAEIYCRQNDDIVYQKVDGTEEDTVYCIEKGNTEL